MAIQIHTPFSKIKDTLVNSGLFSRGFLILCAFVVASSSVLAIVGIANVARGASHVYEQSFQIGNPVDVGIPYVITLDSAGNYYLGSVGDSYIRKYNPAGQLILQFGQAASSGDVGLLSTPYGIAVKSNGDIYVSDGDFARVNVYNASGQFLREITTYGAGQPIIWNWRIASDSSDNLYVIDNSDSIHVYDSSDAYVTTYSNPGSGDGQLTDIYDIDVDTNGDIYALDRANNQVQVFDSSWNFIRRFGSAELTGPYNLSLSGDGHVMIDDTDRDIKKFTTAGVLVQTIGSLDIPNNGSYGLGTGETSEIKDFEVQPNGNVATAEGGAAQRIQIFTSTGTYVDQFGLGSSMPGELGTQTTTAIDPSDNIYVADKRNDRVQKFDSNGNFLFEFGDDSTFLGHPESIAVDPNDGRIYVFDGVSGVCTSRIMVFDSTGSFLNTVGTCGTGNGAFNNLVTELSINSTGELYVSTLTSNQESIQVFDSAGNFLRNWNVGTINSTFGQPMNLGFDASGNVYATTTLSSYVFKYDSVGNLLDVFGEYSPNSITGYFDNPTAIHITSDGTMFVADASNKRVSVMDSSGNFMRSFGSVGFGTDQFQWPNTVAVNSVGEVVVSDSGGGRIVIYDSVLGKDPASAPQNISATSPSQGAIDVSWTAPSNNGGDPIDAYRIEYSLPNSYPSWSVHSETSGSQTSAQLRGLPGGSHNVRVMAINGAGRGTPAQASTVEVDSPLELKKVLSPGKPTEEYLGGFGVYADGSATLLGRYLHNRIQLDINGNTTARLGTQGSSADQLNAPRGSDTDSSDILYISDTVNRRIAKYDKNGNHIENYSTGTRYPLEVKLDEPNNAMYIVTGSSSGSSTGRVDKYTMTGTFVENFAPTVTVARDVDVDSNGDVYIAHSTSTLREVAKYSSAGTLLATYGQNGSNPGDLTTPSGVGVISTGEVVVSDAGTAKRNLNVYQADGTYLGSIGTGSINYLLHGFNAPGDIRVYNDVVYVNDPFSRRVKGYSIYTPPASTVPSEPQNVSADTSTPNQIDVSWTAPSTDGGSPITSYKVEHKKTSEGASSWVEDVVGGGQYSHVISNVQAGSHDVRVSAGNSNGYGVPTFLTDVVVNDPDPIPPTTPPDTEEPTTSTGGSVVVAPSNQSDDPADQTNEETPIGSITVEPGEEAGQVLVSWDEPQITDGVIQEYIVESQPQTSISSDVWDELARTPPSTRAITVTLPPGAFTIRVAAILSGGPAERVTIGFADYTVPNVPYITPISSIENSPESTSNPVALIVAIIGGLTVALFFIIPIFWKRRKKKQQPIQDPSTPNNFYPQR